MRTSYSGLQTFFAISMLIMGVTACKQGKKSGAPAPVDSSDMPQTSVANFIERYFKIKYGLIIEDSSLILLHAKAMAEQLKADTTVQYNDSAVAAMNIVQLQGLAQEMTNAQGYKAKRKVFVQMTEPMKNLLRNVKSDKTYYVQNCNMAPDYSANSNAQWISKESDVYNPLYPKSMGRCGRVIDSVKNK